MNSELAIDLKNVTRKFGKITAVNDLNFSVQKGEIFGLLGPNGAGKTTTINLILGLLKIHQGSIHVLGFDVAAQTRNVHKKSGYVPQDTNLYLDLSAEDNLWHHAALYCEDLKTIKNKMQELLEFTNLWKRRKEPVRTFSGGMKRRLALARALLHDPDVIFFDEPTLGVDVQGRFALWEHIQEQRDQGKTFVISTNNMIEADTLCDRLVIIDHGQAIALDTPENLKSKMEFDIVSIRTSPIIKNPEALLSDFPIRKLTLTQTNELRFEMKNAETQAAALINQINRTHNLDSILITHPSLDDVFLSHTGRALRE